MATFGERLSVLRKERKSTQKQIAVIFGVTERAYQRYEGNQSTPNYATLIALADYFDVSLDYLVGRSDDPARR
jgi:transcriptional regulator with XRE-family HTH domain